MNDPASPAVKTSTHPLLQDIFHRRDKWSEPKPKKAPLTMEMIAAMHAALLLESAQPTKIPSFCTKLAALYDWQTLNLFTGCRISEYGQSRTTKGCKWLRIPREADAGPWAGMPVAFIAADFVFYTITRSLVPHSALLQSAFHPQVNEVHLRFRFDKSKVNFNIKVFRRLPGAPICPVQSAINIIMRACLMRVPASEPVGRYFNQAHQRCFIRDYDVRTAMREACLRAYPDPNNYHRIHISQLVSHSNRVTAAVCLMIGGADLDTIALKLRWQRDSVPTYLREHLAFVDQAMQKAVAGCMLNWS